jgi:hypothetical protein
MPVVLLLHTVVPALLPSMMTLPPGLDEWPDLCVPSIPSGQHQPYYSLKYLLEQPGVHCLRLSRVTVTIRKSVKKQVM